MKIKLFSFLLVPLLLFFGNPASAKDYQEQLSEVKAQRAEIKAQIVSLEGLEGEAKERAWNENIRLGMEDNKLAAYEKAYEQAAGVPGEIFITDSAAFSSFVPVDILPGQKVPAEYIPYYKEAGEKYGVDWFVLAAIHSIETNFSTIPKMVSSAGAQGHMQFIPATFEAYGVDGNGDGMRSAWDLQDAIYSAANYLSASGYSTDVRRAIWHYNHAEWYVNDVLQRATAIKNS
ncbi:lytic murein transglycosylase [Bacillus infantis]|uniref:lytic transglycosylase domain-containing protein n=1 Tax=Bacillus infantis TaxID=324767 RepID=UPI002FBDEDA3